MQSAPKGTCFSSLPISRILSTPRSDQKRSSKEDKLSFDLLIKIHHSKINIHDKIEAIINITITDLTTKLAFRKRVKIEVSINIKVNFSFSNIASEEAGKV